MHLTVEGKRIGSGERCFLIAELSANHDKDLDHALALVDAAADAGWDAVKFQTYTADSLAMASDHPSCRIDPVWGFETLHDLYRDAAMPMDFHGPLFDRARERGLVPFTSIYDPRDLDFVAALDCPIYKIASFEMTYDDLLVALAGTGKPIILSTGMADLAEVDHALSVLAANDAGPVILLHCVSAYPTPPEAANLAAIEVLRARYGDRIGFSDHTIGAKAALAAAALGSVAIEKHITTDTARSGPDHRFSATPAILREIADGVREVHALRGDGGKSARDVEKVNKAVGRRSAFALRDLAPGETIAPADFRFVRPGAGIPANQRHRVIGRTVRRPVPRAYPITEEDLEP